MSKWDKSKEKMIYIFRKLSIPLKTVECLVHAWYHIDLASHLHLDTHSDYNSPQSGQYVNRTIDDPAPENRRNVWRFAELINDDSLKQVYLPQFNKSKKVYYNKVHLNVLPAIWYIWLIFLQLYYRYKPPAIKIIILLIETFFFVFNYHTIFF